MTEHRLAHFILENMEPILRDWEAFARTIEPPALTMDDKALRDHARQMLEAIAKDLGTSQSGPESKAKSRGLGKRDEDDTAAETHAELRLRSGYTVVQLVSEYRALRSCVLRLWSEDRTAMQSTDLGDMTRFNEAIDQALAESIARYEYLVTQAQNMFLAILGHDLRNPLGTLIGGSNLIMLAADIAPQYALTAARMFSGAKRMSRLIDDLIDFTRSHLGPGIPVDPRKGNIAALCERVVSEARTAHPERKVELHAPHLLEASFDEARLAQVLSNLIGNALQYGSKEEPVTIDVAGDGNDVTIAVNNQGPLIPPELVASIFDPMVRIASNTDPNHADRNSLGIGLFISREIVQAHGGKIALTSNSADGTTFTVSIPRT